MSPESAFPFVREYVCALFRLEGWTELPSVRSEDWQSMCRWLTHVDLAENQVTDVLRKGDDLLLMVRLSGDHSPQSFCEYLRLQFRDPWWIRCFDNQRFVWTGGYQFAGVSPAWSIAEAIQGNNGHGDLDTEKLFQQEAGSVHIRLVLEDWTALPDRASPAWEQTRQCLLAASPSGIRVLEVDHNGFDLFLRLSLPADVTVQQAVQEFRALWSDPIWQFTLENDRCSWIGEYEARSVRISDSLNERALETPQQAGKRIYMEHDTGRAVPLPWHEAADPAEAGINYRECLVLQQPNADLVTLYVHYSLPLDTRQEGFAAAQLNTRLRLPGSGRTYGSQGWKFEQQPSEDSIHVLVFVIPASLLPVPPETVEVLWRTHVQQSVAILPCRKAPVPDYL